MTSTRRDFLRRSALLATIQDLDSAGPTLRSVQELNPDALAIARALDAEGARKRRGPLHGTHP